MSANCCAILGQPPMLFPWGFAEALPELQAKGSNITFSCVMPYETVAKKWTPTLRERHFTSLDHCTEVLCPNLHKTPTSMLDSYKFSIDMADFILAVYDPEYAGTGPIEHALQYAYDENKDILFFHPQKLELTTI